MSKFNIEIGDWILIEYGFDHHKFCVLGTSSSVNKVLLGSPEWLNSSAQWFDVDSKQVKDATYLGRGGINLFHHIFKYIGLGDLIFPYSSSKQG